MYCVIQVVKEGIGYGDFRDLLCLLNIFYGHSLHTLCINVLGRLFVSVNVNVVAHTVCPITIRCFMPLIRSNDLYCFVNSGVSPICALC